jgi:hypothetical protein
MAPVLEFLPQYPAKTNVPKESFMSWVSKPAECFLIVGALE